MDANDCREYSKRCIEMANNALNGAQSTLRFDLATAWTKLAAELDRDEAFRNQVIDLSIFPSVAGDGAS